MNSEPTIVRRKAGRPKGSTSNNKAAWHVEDKSKLLAFELYYSKGSNRSLSVVAKELGTTIQTISNWAKKFYWNDRIRSRDLAEVKEITQLANRDTTAIKLEWADNLRNTIMGLYDTDPETGKTKFNFEIKNIYEWETAVKTFLLLNGEATDIHSVRVDIVVSMVNLIVKTLNIHIKDPHTMAAVAKDLRQVLIMAELPDGTFGIDPKGKIT